MTCIAIDLPRDSILFGNAAAFIKNGLEFWRRCERLGPLVRARIYHVPLYVVTGPELIEEVLVKKNHAFGKPKVLKSLELLFGDGLLTADGELWRHRRRVLQPVFHPQQTPEYASVVHANIEAILSRLENGKVHNIHATLLDLCIKNLTESFFGVSDSALTEQIKGVAHFCQLLLKEMASYRFFFYLLAPPLIRWRFGAKLEALEKGLTERVAELRARCPHPERLAGDMYSRLEAGSDIDGCPFSRRAKRDEMVTMLLAGHETAAAAASWALYLLAEHPEVRARLVAELDAVCGDALPTFADLERLPLLDRVLRETYRLYPPTHRVGRRVLEPVVIGGTSFVRGAEVVVPQWAVHRSERYYEAPDAFRPDRWTSEFTAQLPRFAYLPFSAGPRVCIGQSFVRMEDALLIGSICKRFDFELAEPEKLEPVEGLTLLPGHHGRVRLKLSARTKKSQAAA